ncbi:tyrosine-type recombinase/integrase [Nocardia barduliensis]|uniref:tyrosine-type recombinase/integrase n=1 Tax=Nocardia barduliensis TaxID=2736643 RepID=UPI001574841D|nr:tyrosine-type recombinase/integrase [Nocardia barduliensis]
MRALLDQCAGTDFDSRRDNAIIRLFADTGCRCGEVANLGLDDLDFEENSALVVGKGGRPRSSPFGDKTRIALRRYLRARNQHQFAKKSDRLWLGRQGPMTDHGIRQMLERRAEAAGIDHIHPHMLRHWFAHNWLANGGQEQDLICWRDGAPGRCSTATASLWPTSERRRRTAARASATSCSSRSCTSTCSG